MPSPLKHRKGTEWLRGLRTTPRVREAVASQALERHRVATEIQGKARGKKPPPVICKNGIGRREGWVPAKEVKAVPLIATLAVLLATLASCYAGRLCCWADRPPCWAGLVAGLAVFVAGLDSLLRWPSSLLD